LLFNFALDYAIRRVQVTQDGLKLNGTHQLLVYADDVNMLGGSVHTVKENAEALLVGSEEIGLEVHADKTKYMVMSGDGNAGQSHSMKIDNSSFERVEQFKYLGITLTDQILIRKKLRADWSQGMSAIFWCGIFCLSVCYTKIMRVVLYGCETWSLTLWEERSQRAFEKMALRKIF